MKTARWLGWGLVVGMGLLLNLPGVATAQGKQDDGQKIYKQTLKGTVWILRPVDEESFITGSGVLVDMKNRIVVTNYHVVGEARQVAVFFPVADSKGTIIADRKAYFQMLRQGRHIVGDVLMTNKSADLAIVKLKVLAPGVRAVALAKASPNPADRVHSVGSPGAVGALWIYTPGSVRQVYKGQLRCRLDKNTILDIDAWLVLTNSETNEGDSGGPLVNDKGELVGITQGGSATGKALSTFIDVREVRALLNRAGIRSPVAGGNDTATASKNNTEDGDGGGDSGSNKTAAKQPASDTKDPEKANIIRLSNQLINARASERTEVLEKFQTTKGVEYTQALANAIPKLTGSFQDKARQALAERLKRMSDKTLKEYLKDEDPVLRRGAIGGIARKEAKDLLKDLVPLLKDSESDVAEEAYDALCKLTGQDFGKAADKWQKFLNK